MEVNASGVATTGGGRDAVRWYELQGIASPATPSVVQSGTVFDSAAANPLSFWIPSVMVSGQGHAALGFSRAGAAARADGATSGRLAGDTLGTTQAVTLLTASSTAYNLNTNPPGNVRRWGDYSYTSLDPLDDMTMWTIQEFCDATNSYAVRIVKLVAPPPATPAAADPPQYAGGQGELQRHGHWNVRGRFRLLRSGNGHGALPFSHIAASVTGGVTVNSVTYVDPTTVVLNLSTVSASQGLQTVTITNPDGQAAAAAIFTVLAPSAVGLASFTATPSPADSSAVLVRWTTGFEVENLGFNVFRESNGRRERLNPRLIAGSAIASISPDSAARSRAYGLVDHPPSRNAVYWLEDVDLRGKGTRHGPIAIAAGDSVARPGASDRLLTLRDLGLAESHRTAGDAQFAPRNDGASKVAGSPDLASREALKITVRRDGWYRIVGATIAGLAGRGDPRLLQLWADGRQVPMVVSGEQDGSLDPSDSIEFLGRGLDLPTTDGRVYWLVAGDTPGLRIKSVSAATTRGSTTSFTHVVERKDRLNYFPALLNGDTENFFGAVVTSDPIDQPLAAENVDSSSQSSAVLEVTVQGVTRSSHSVRVSLNGRVLGTIGFAELGHATGRYLIPPSQLVSGSNSVELVSVGQGYDVSLVDTIRLTYAHTSNADGHAIAARVSSTRTSPGRTIGGFSSAEIRVLDMTEPAAPIELVGTVGRTASGYAVSVATPVGLRTIYAFDPSAVLQPDSISVNRPSNWRANAGADVVMVGQSSMLPSLEPLAALRQAQGYTVAVVDVEDVYDEFAGGAHTPQALRDFFAWTQSRWTKRPRFVLLAGGCSFDPRDHFGLGQHDLVPTKLVDATYLEAASDDWLVDFDDDGLPDVAIGRLPARDPEQASAMVAKIVRYESGASADGALLVSDSTDGYDFGAASEVLRGEFPPAVPVDTIRRGTVDDATAHAQLLSALGSGRRFVDWTGHGSVDLWRGVLNSTDAAALPSGSPLAVFTMMTCLNGYDIDPLTACIGEAFLAAPDRGAVAVWASTGETVPTDQVPAQREFYRLLFSGEPLTLGEAAARAKGATGQIDARRTWVFLGDPVTRAR